MCVVAFVLLNYQTYKDTIECVNSLEKLKKDNFKLNIVIVDNGSSNESFNALFGKYNNREDIHLIESKENLGFARGNNLGYKYARDILGADIIIVQNNDTIIKDDMFVDKAINYMNEYDCDIIGPDILTIDGFHQNPVTIQAKDKKSITKLLFRLRILYFRELVGCSSILKKRNKHNINVQDSNYKSIKFNVPLHGACYIFLNSFIEKMCIPFYPNTFLYLEEDILYYVSKVKGFKMMYNPRLQILHKEDASTDFMTNGNNRKKMMFVFKNQINSCKAFLELINGKLDIDNIFNS